MLTDNGIFSNLPTIETERLILRKVTLRDANDVFEYAGNPEVSKTVLWETHRTVSDSIHFLNTCIQQYKQDLPSNWGIVLKENNKLIGTLGYLNWFKQWERIEIGYVLSPAYWNKGIMTEAVREIIKYGFEQLNANRIEARCYVENSASEKVMIKNGMTYEGTMRSYVKKNDKLIDLKMYSILKEEYKP